MKRYVPTLVLLVLFSCGKDSDLETYVLNNTEEEEIVDNPTENPTEEGSGDNDSNPDPGDTNGNGTDYPTDGVKVSTFGFDANDSTDALKEALLSEHETIIVDKQDTDWIIGPIVAFNVKNKRIFFENGVTLRAKQGAFPEVNQVLLNFRNAEDVAIEGYGATFKMNKEEYTTGEHRHALSLSNCKNVTLKGLTLRDSGGDGIIISGESSIRGSYSDNIVIEDIKSINNKRQGITITSAKNVWVRNSFFTETKGTLPEAGLDIEPNYFDDKVVNINFENCQFTNNNHAGIVIGLNHLTSASDPVSITFKDCFLSYNATVENQFIDSEIVFGSNSDDPVQGDVLFDGLEIDGSQWGMMYARKGSDAFNVTFRDCVAKNICQAGTFSPIALELADYNNITESLGGFTFDNVHFEFDTDVPFFLIRGFETLQKVEDIIGGFTVKSPNSAESIRYENYDPARNVNVAIDYNYVD